MTTTGSYPGASLGLPESGPGSVASQGRKLGGVVVDLFVSALVGLAITLPSGHPSPWTRNLAGTGAFLVEVLVLTTLTGQSVGMRVLGMRLVWRDGGLPPLRWAFVRLFFFCFPLPGILPVLMDSDRRGLHDRAAGTVCVLTS